MDTMYGYAGETEIGADEKCHELESKSNGYV
jgi:hypothetical protein